MQLSAVRQEKSAPGEFHPHVMRPPCVNLISWGLGAFVWLWRYRFRWVHPPAFGSLWLICRPHKESHRSISKTIKIPHDRLHCRHFISLAWNFCKDTQNFSDIIYRRGKIIIYGYFHLKQLFLGNIEFQHALQKCINDIRRPDNHRIKQLSPQIAW